MPSVIQKLLATLPIKNQFENLTDGEFAQTSPFDPDYNCIAYAAGKTDRNWWPIRGNFAKWHWPKGVSTSESVKSFVTAFKTFGYSRCVSADLEPGFEKVAIFVSTVPTALNPKGIPTHMAIQLESGKWSSKLGSAEDISHDRLEDIGGKFYGEVKQILKRRRLTKRK